MLRPGRGPEGGGEEERGDRAEKSERDRALAAV